MLRAPVIGQNGTLANVESNSPAAGQAQVKTGNCVVHPPPAKASSSENTGRLRRDQERPSGCVHDCGWQRADLRTPSSSTRSSPTRLAWWWPSNRVCTPAGGVNGPKRNWSQPVATRSLSFRLRTPPMVQRSPPNAVVSPSKSATVTVSAE